MKAFFRKYKIELLLLFFLVLVTVLVVYLRRPVPVEKVFSMELGSDIYIYVNSVFDETLQDARPESEELQPLRELLEDGTLQLVGRKQSIRIDTEAELHLYELFSDHYPGRGGHISLRSDGVLYSPIFLGELYFGFAEYRLTGCDMVAVETELQRLLDMGSEN